MRYVTEGYLEEEICVDGVRAIRRRKQGSIRKSQELYLYLPMSCVTALADAKLCAAAWPLALWVMWHHIVAKRPVAVTSQFALRAGVASRAARRHAVEALAASRLFHVSRNGTTAATVAPTTTLKAMMKARSS